MTELENLLDQRQAAASRQLARLRREGQAIFHSICVEKVRETLALLGKLFATGPAQNRR